MFDDTFEMVEQCTETFRAGVRDTFGASIIADVLDPIRNQIVMLRTFREESQRVSFEVERILQEARSMSLSAGSSP